jgi:DNA-binding MarR family transcriptional regulator
MATTTTVRDDDLAELSDALAMVVRQANLPRSFDRLAEVAGVRLERTAFPILRCVALGTVGLSSLAAELDVDLSTMSRQVATIEASGLLARTADPDDGRAVVLALTPEGGEVLKRMRATRRALVGEQLVDWSDEEVADLARLLRRLADRFLRPPTDADAADADAGGTNE